MNTLFGAFLYTIRKQRSKRSYGSNNAFTIKGILEKLVGLIILPPTCRQQLNNAAKEAKVAVILAEERVSALEVIVKRTKGSVQVKQENEVTKRNQLQAVRQDVDSKSDRVFGASGSNCCSKAIEACSEAIDAFQKEMIVYQEYTEAREELLEAQVAYVAALRETTIAIRSVIAVLREQVTGLQVEMQQRKPSFRLGWRLNGTAWLCIGLSLIHCLLL